MANTAARKKAKIQKAGAGLLIKRDEGKSDLVNLEENEDRDPFLNFAGSFGKALSRRLNYIQFMLFR
jgi:hypothetical protein